MYLLIDNYDSFTYNLWHYLGEEGAEIEVVRNDAISADEALARKPEGIVISPGPCDPDRAGICLELIEKAAKARVPLFGVCLGFQSIGQAFGGKVVRATPMHGKVDTIHHKGKGVFKGIPGETFQATRYHSLIVERASLPDCLEVTAETGDGLIMGLSHKTLPIHGVQFHPESIASQYGHEILRNFIDMTGKSPTKPKPKAKEPAMTEPAPIMQELIGKVATGASLTESEAQAAFEAIMSGEATDAQIGGFLMALRVRGETVEEITGAVSIMRAKALTLEAPDGAIDLVGTGGDASGTYNISTGAAIVVAGCGVPVAKHGNKALSSKSGAADVLTALGVDIQADMEKVKKSIWEAKIGFLMAPRHHAAMKYVMPARMELKTRTIFNLLGPLSNPAGVKRQMTGVFSKEWVEPFAHVLNRLGCEKAWIVHGSDGLDELTTTGPTDVAALEGGKVTTFQVTPEDAGLKKAKPADLKGGDPATNAKAIIDMLDGKQGAYRDVVVLNAAAGLIVAGKAKDLKDGAKQAAKAIDSGAAKAVLTSLCKITNG